MSRQRTLLASLVIAVAGVATLAAATDGLQAFTSESALRASVARKPRPLPDAPLETAQGTGIDASSSSTPTPADRAISTTAATSPPRVGSRNA